MRRKCWQWRCSDCSKRCLEAMRVKRLHRWEAGIVTWIFSFLFSLKLEHWI